MNQGGYLDANNYMMTRREMFSSMGAAYAAFTLTSALSPLYAAPGDRRFKIGACEWSLGKSDPSCMEVARQIGLDGVEVNMGNAANKMKLRQTAVQKAYLEAAKKNGVEIASLAMAETNSVPIFSEPQAAIWLLDSIAVCQALKIKVVLLAMFGTGELKAGDAISVNRVVELLKEIGPRAEKAGVIIGLENYLSAADNVKILDRVGCPAVQVYYDVGNSTDKGYDILKEIRLLGKRICMFHAKDGGFMLGQGRIDFKAVRAAMDDIEYKGWIQIEAAAPKGIVDDYRTHLAFLRSHFSAE